MGDENTKVSALDELNQQFMQMQESSEKKAISVSIWERIDKEKLKGAGAIAVKLVLILIVLLLLKAIILNNSKKNIENLSQYENYLSSEEQEQWKTKEIDPDELFIQVNTKVTVDEKTQEAVLHLVNPPYSAYELSVEIYLSEDSEQILYHSERINPGTLVETFEMAESLKEGMYPVIIRYTFYDGEETLGSHLVAGEFLIQ